MQRALASLALGASIVLSACTVHIYPASTTPEREDAPAAPEEEQPEPKVRPEQRDPEPPPQPVEPRRRPAPDPQPQPQREPERRQPIVPQLPVEPEPQELAWVCHGEVNPQWMQVASADAEAHRQHGDPVSTEPQEAGTACQRTEDEPAPDRRRPDPPEPEQPPVPQEPVEPEPAHYAWVCHGDENPQWIRVLAPAADPHRQHGDPVSMEAQTAGAPCTRGQEEPPVEPPPARQPLRPASVFVCHGEQDPRWLRVAPPAAEAHRRHGDPVSTQPQTAGATCVRGEEVPPPQQPEPSRQREDQPPRPQPQRPGRTDVWVCHGETDARWLRVPAQAAEAHRQHGDPVSTEQQEAGTPCARGEEPAPQRREPRPQPQRDPREPEPPPSEYAWACHGTQNPTWMQLPLSAVEGHRQHGDPVSAEPQEAGTPCERGEPEAPPEQPPPQEPQQPEQPQEQQFAWVCHGEENPQWLRVAMPAVDAHRQHGDTVSTEPQEAGTPCERGEPEAPPDQPPPQEPPPQPQTSEFVWVCHGTRDPTWQRVAASAREAHERHGDPVSTTQQEVGARCER